MTAKHELVDLRGEFSLNGALHPINTRKYTFDRFPPRRYLTEYYGKVGEKIGFENDALLRFFAETYGTIRIPRNAKVLEFGGGPTIYSLISAAPHVGEIHFSDHLHGNIAEVMKWKNNDPDSFPWSRYVRRGLHHEGMKEPTEDEVKSREQLIRVKMTEFLSCDAMLSNPLGLKYKGEYDVVSMNFVAESITDEPQEYKRILENVASLLKPGGFLVTTGLEKAQYYLIGGLVFPATYVRLSDIKQALGKLGFGHRNAYTISSQDEVRRNNTPGRNFRFQGYEGMTFYVGKKQNRMGAETYQHTSIHTSVNGIKSKVVASFVQAS